MKLQVTTRALFLSVLFLFGIFFVTNNALAAGEPVVIDRFAEDIMPTSARPTAEVTDEGIAAVIGVWVEYGTTNSYGSEVQRYNLFELTIPGVIDASLSGLTCGTTYHYRFRVRNNGLLDGYSPDATFTTTPCYPSDIVSHWTLNEASGTRVDSVGDNDLSPMNAPLTKTGQVNDGVEATVAGTDYLSIADNASLSTGGETSFTVSMWVKLNAKTGTQVFASKFSSVSTGEYAVYFENLADRFVFSTYGNNQNYFVYADEFGSPDIGTWYYITATHNALTNTNSIAVNNGVADTLSSVAEHQDSTASFLIGAFGSGPLYYANAVIDEVRFSKTTYVNSAPVLNATRTPVLVSVAENAGAPVGAVGTQVSSFVDFTIPAGGLDNVSDSDGGAVTGIAITAIESGGLTCYYSMNSGASWIALGAVSNTAARLLAADSNNRIYCAAGTGISGTFSTAITFRAWDQTSGTNGATADTSTNGSTSAFSSVTDTASLLVVASDTTAPIIESVSPADGTTGTAIDVPLVITFSEPMNISSIVVSSGPCDGSCPTYDEVWSSGNTVLTLTKSNGLFTANTEYTIEITDAEDVAGNNISETYTWSFTTYVPLVLTEVTPIPAQVTAASAIYYFSSNDNPEDNAEYESDACSAPEGDNIEVLIDPIAHTYYFRGLVVGHTYECNFRIVATYRGTSELLRVGPFTVIAPPSSGSSSGYNPSMAWTPTQALSDPKTCPANQLLTQNLKSGSRNGKYNSYTKGIVKEAHILQAHLNRLGFSSGKEDGILGPKSTAAIKKLQAFLGTATDGYIGPKTRELLNGSCK